MKRQHSLQTPDKLTSNILSPPSTALKKRKSRLNNGGNTTIPGAHTAPWATDHWHVEDKGIRHAYIKRGTPQLNGKVERTHRSDEQEFYQLLSYKDDVDLEAKLGEWEQFYNFARPHGAFNGKTPYEALREKL